MSFARAFVFALLVTLVAPQAFAQDDLIVPLPKKTKTRSGKKRAPAKRGATAKKSEAAAPEGDDLFVPIPSKKGATAKKPAAAAPEGDDLFVPIPSKKGATAKGPDQAPADDDLIVPIEPGKTGLLVRLSGGVKGAHLFVDNKDMGTLPMASALPASAGEHTVSIRRLGFSDFTRRVTVQRGKSAEVEVTLEAVAGVVTVTADVAGANVTLNGQPKGQAPVANLLLKPGSYEIVVSKEGFQPETKSLAVKAGKDYTVAASLRPAEVIKPTVVASVDRPEKPVLTPSDSGVKSPPVPLTPEKPAVSTSSPWYKRWYVWAGVGVVAAAAVGTVAATQGGSAKPLTPDFVCGGACDGTINGIVRAGGR
ncbi:MAG: PEGA domain-containing protein [Hyalangium sp.]|uniref:PEGA domain-containing protein n=1 Tax=Hyalangium sp. TaxID=2028555 RepID=UPI00389ACF81